MERGRFKRIFTGILIEQQYGTLTHKIVVDPRTKIPLARRRVATMVRKAYDDIDKRFPQNESDSTDRNTALREVGALFDKIAKDDSKRVVPSYLVTLGLSMGAIASESDRHPQISLLVFLALLSLFRDNRRITLLERAAEEFKTSARGKDE